MKKALLLCMITVLFFAGCNKDQKAVKRLDGNWQVTEITVDGTVIQSKLLELSNFIMKDSIADFTGITSYSFQECKVKKDNCDGTMYGTVMDSSVVKLSGLDFPFIYTISDKGGKIDFTVAFNDTIAATTTTATIIEQTKTSFIFEIGATKTIITLEKEGTESKDE